MTWLPDAQQYPIVTHNTPIFYFIGVTTGKSAIMKVFPLWVKELGRPEIVIEGVDLKIHDRPEAYRDAVAQIKYDPLSLGGLVTTHKMDVMEAARDMFDYLDPYAVTCGEVSCISKLDGRLEGHAKDPITVGLSMNTMLGKDYFSRTGGEVLIFGAGGSSMATLLHLINQKDAGDRPRHCCVVNRSQGRLDGMQKMVAGQQTDIEVTCICNQDPLRNDAIMGALPEYSIVINATGMGKDAPGSLVTDAGLFPRNGIAWDYNYRGELDFMQQALRQRESRNVFVEDGWLYFVYGWAHHLAQVLHFELTPEIFSRLETLSASVRGK